MSACGGSLSMLRSLSQAVIESEENSNSLVDLLEYLQSDNLPVLKAAIFAVCDVYCHLVTENYSWIVHTQLENPTLSARKNDDVTQQYRDWMRKNYGICVERLLQLFQHENKDIQDLAIDSLMKLVEAEGCAHQASHHLYNFPNALFHQVVMAILNGSLDTRNLIGRLQAYLEFDDVRYYWLRNIASIILVNIDKKRKPANLGPHFVENVYHSLQQVQMPAREEEIGRFFTGDPPPLEEDGGEEEEGGRSGPPKAKRRKIEVKALSVRMLHKHRKQFSDAWLAFLRLPLSSSVYKKVLVSLHSDVMPHLQEPRLLIDFLVDSYDAGGVVSILALNGLFILMHEHHLDYPDFFIKLYALLEPSIFHVKYTQRFFRLLDTFLKSTHLPLYLVAAFAKKIARLSLTAPPTGVMVAVVFVTNLIKRHPNCRVLLHRKSTEDIELSSDPFDMSVPDPAQCGALASCLWEVKTLQSHYVPAVSNLVKRLLNPEGFKREEDLRKYLDIDSQQLFAKEGYTEIKPGTEVPLNFVEPSGLWTTEELKDSVT